MCRAIPAVRIGRHPMSTSSPRTICIGRLFRDVLRHDEIVVV